MAGVAREAPWRSRSDGTFDDDVVASPTFQTDPESLPVNVKANTANEHVHSQNENKILCPAYVGVCCLCVCQHLEVIDTVLCVQVDAH